MRRIGVLMAVAERDLEAEGYIKAFVQALHELGWAHGRNVQIEYRWGGGNLDRIRTYAAELVGLKPDPSRVPRPPTRIAACFTRITQAP
jgi:putative ABC transport system substrate-binding protein